MIHSQTQARTQAYIHTINTSIETIIGEKSARFLSQLIYWINKSGKIIPNSNEKWIYNSITQWQKQFSNWSLSTIQRIIKKLENLKLIKSLKLKAKYCNHIKYYTVNYDAYSRLFGINLNHNIKKTQSIKPTITNPQNIKISTSNNTKTTITQMQEEIVKNMIHTWNNILQYANKPIKAYYIKSNIIKLFNIFEKFFNKDIKQFEKYVIKINSSKFLMGEKCANFKATFSWLIQEETIQKILNDEYGIGDRIADFNNISTNINDKTQEISNNLYKKILDKIKNKVNIKSEEEFLDQYLDNAEYNKDNDQYNIKILTEYQSSYALKNTKKNIYYIALNSFLFKKYTNLNQNELLQTIKTKINDKIKSLNNNIEILNYIKDIEEKIINDIQIKKQYSKQYIKQKIKNANILNISQNSYDDKFSINNTNQNVQYTSHTLSNKITKFSQNDQIDLIKMNKSYMYTKNTSTNILLYNNKPKSLFSVLQKIKINLSL